MAEDIKPIVSFKESFEKLDIRVGKVIEVEFESSTHKPTYKPNDIRHVDLRKQWVYPVVFSSPAFGTSNNINRLRHLT